MTGPVIGVLALQGDVREHLRALEAAGARPAAVRRPEELDRVDGLVIPGGESTTMWRLAVAFDLLEPLRKLIGEGLPAFGSCAGMIMLADRMADGVDRPADLRRHRHDRAPERVRPPGRLLRGRHHPGRRGADERGPFRAVFIRAPWVEQTGPGVAILGTDLGTGRIVAVRQGQLLATAFHPELTGDRRIHQLFVDIVKDNT